MTKIPKEDLQAMQIDGEPGNHDGEGVVSVSLYGMKAGRIYSTECDCDDDCLCSENECDEAIDECYGEIRSNPYFDSRKARSNRNELDEVQLTELRTLLWMRRNPRGAMGKNPRPFQPRKRLLTLLKTRR